MSKGTSSDLNSEQDLASIPTAQGGLSRLAIARLTGVPVEPLLRRVGLTPEVIADPEQRLIVRSQIKLLDEETVRPPGGESGRPTPAPHERSLLRGTGSGRPRCAQCLSCSPFRGVPKDALRVQLADGKLMNPAAKRTIDRDRL